MDLAQSSSTTQVGAAGTTRIGRMAFVAGVTAVVAVTAVLAITLLAGSRGDLAARTQADPLVGPAAIEFRVGEHAMGAAQSDPLVGPAAIEFRPVSTASTPGRAIRSSDRPPSSSGRASTKDPSRRSPSIDIHLPCNARGCESSGVVMPSARPTLHTSTCRRPSHGNAHGS